MREDNYNYNYNMHQRFEWCYFLPSSGLYRHFADMRPFMKAPARSSVFFIFLFFLAAGAFVFTRVLYTTVSINILYCNTLLLSMIVFYFIRERNFTRHVVVFRDWNGTWGGEAPPLYGAETHWKRRVSEFIKRHVGACQCIRYTWRVLLWSKIDLLDLNTRLECRLSLAVKLLNLTRS